MSHESQPAKRYEAVKIPAYGPNGEKLMIAGNMPTKEFYPDEINRLVAKAMRGLPKQNMGWNDEFGAVLSFKEKKWTDDGPGQFQLGEFRDASRPVTDPALQIRLVTIYPSEGDVLGEHTRPMEFKFFWPALDEMSIVHFDALSDIVFDDPERFSEAISIEQRVNPIEITQKDRFFFYTSVCFAAGEKMPQLM